MEHQVLHHKSPSSGICTDDSVELFIDVGRRQPQGRDYVQVMLTASGVVWRYHWTRFRVRGKDMPEFGIRGKVWRGPKRWTAEVAFSLTKLAALTDGVAPPGDGDEWGMNLYRNRRHRKFKANVSDRYARSSTGWSPTFSTYHNSRRFGILRFEE